MLNIFLPILDAAPASAPAGGGTSMLVFILLMIVVFYFFMIRPQQKRQKKLEEARSSLQKGDKVVTIGGIHGKITDIKDNTFTIEIAHDVRIEVDKAAISFNEAALNQKSETKKEDKSAETQENE